MSEQFIAGTIEGGKGDAMSRRRSKEQRLRGVVRYCVQGSPTLLWCKMRLMTLAAGHRESNHWEESQIALQRGKSPPPQKNTKHRYVSSFSVFTLYFCLRPKEALFELIL